MAWIVFDLDNCLLEDSTDEMTGEPAGSVPTDGALEAVQTLTGECHRLTVYTSRFAPMPETGRQRLKEQIGEELMSVGFPPMEVWTGTTKPAADLFIGDNHVTYDGDWGLVLAQTQQMLEDRGLVPPPMEGAIDGLSPEEAEVPQEPTEQDDA